MKCYVIHMLFLYVSQKQIFNLVWFLECKLMHDITKGSHWYISGVPNQQLCMLEYSMHASLSKMARKASASSH